MSNIDYLCNKDAAKVLSKNYFVEKNSGVILVERGTIVPYVPTVENGQRILEFGGLVNSKGRFIKSSVGKFGADDLYTPTEDLQYVPETVIYLGLFYPIWGHFITEGLRYFWALHNDAFKKFFKDCRFAYVPCEFKYYLEQHKNFRRLAEIIGLDCDKLIPIEHPTQFENVILPDESFFLDVDGLRKFTDTYRETVDRVRDFALKNRTPTSAKKIYYFYGKIQIGEERLAEYFRSKGYEVFSPEKLTLDEQLNLLINAESFASTLGSCSHNSLFLRDNTEVILIPRAANRFTGYQPSIDQVHPLNVNYVDSSLSLFDTYNGPYCFIISERLKKFFGDKFTGYTDEDFKTFLEYARFSIGKSFNINPNAENYYGKALQKFLTRLKQRTDLTTAYGVNLQ